MKKGTKKILYTVGAAVLGMLGYTYLKSGMGLSKLKVTLNGLGFDDISTSGLTLYLEFRVVNGASYSVTLDSVDGNIVDDKGKLLATFDKSVKTVCPGNNEATTTGVKVTVGFADALTNAWKFLSGGLPAAVQVEGRAFVNGNKFPFKVTRSLKN